MTFPLHDPPLQKGEIHTAFGALIIALKREHDETQSQTREDTFLSWWTMGRAEEGGGGGETACSIFIRASAELASCESRSSIACAKVP